MKKIIHFNITLGDNLYVAECVEFPIVTQGLTIDETILNIKEALSLHLEDENLDYYSFIAQPAVSVSMDLGELEYA
jgi:predicted RNase H-like HicB family nuclease